MIYVREKEDAQPLHTRRPCAFDLQGQQEPKIPTDFMNQMFKTRDVDGSLDSSASFGQPDLLVLDKLQTYRFQDDARAPFRTACSPSFHQTSSLIRPRLFGRCPGSCTKAHPPPPNVRENPRLHGPSFRWGLVWVHSYCTAERKKGPVRSHILPVPVLLRVFKVSQRLTKYTYNLRKPYTQAQTRIPNPEPASWNPEDRTPHKTPHTPAVNRQLPGNRNAPTAAAARTHSPLSGPEP